MANPTLLPFLKMHGLGNDFVVLDARERPLDIGPGLVQALADRHTGVGCDQVITLEKTPNADVRMRIHNADGGEVEACGNAARCVGWLLSHEIDRPEIVIETKAGLIAARPASGGRVSVDLGQPRFEWRDIPLAREMDTLSLDYAVGPLCGPVAVNVGNPHIVFFVADAEAVDLASLGPRMENDPLFPARVNVNVAQILSPDRIRLRVWERGAGLTLACGTGACASLAAAFRRGLAKRNAIIVLDGGELDVTWFSDIGLRMTGPVTISFVGQFNPQALLSTGAWPASTILKAAAAP
jgi:diaminopimelate epimerase